jgi:hypothetical protein
MTGNEITKLVAAVVPCTCAPSLLCNNRLAKLHLSQQKLWFQLPRTPLMMALRVCKFPRCTLDISRATDLIVKYS